MIEAFAKKFPVDGMTKMPMGWPLMAEAWACCLEWAITQEPTRDNFKAATGYDLMKLVNRTAIDNMIDQSTGFEKQVMLTWLDWATENIWGLEGSEPPADLQQSAALRRKERVG